MIEKYATIDPSTGCHLWNGRRDNGGYGRIQVLGIPLRAHHVLYTLHNGPIPKGMVVMHKCDNPPCVNPDHLSVGTHLDNTRDMIAKGRNYHARMKQMNRKELIAYLVDLEDRAEKKAISRQRGLQLREERERRIAALEDAPRRAPTTQKGGYRLGGSAAGQHHSTAKLNDNQVLEILRSKDRGIDLAARYNVSVATISKIKTGRLWSHLPRPKSQPDEDWLDLVG